MHTNTNLEADIKTKFLNNFLKWVLITATIFLNCINSHYIKLQVTNNIPQYNFVSDGKLLFPKKKVMNVVWRAEGLPADKEAC